MTSLFSPLPVIIAGAGIGGLCAARVLQQLGLAVVLLERAPQRESVGAGIVLCGNAMDALQRLGCAAAVRNAGMAVHSRDIRRYDGRLLNAVPLAPRGRAGSAIGIDRGALQAILYAAAAEFVRLNHTLVDFTQETEGVTVQLAHGHELRGHALVGADGLRSRVRALLWGDEPPRYAGYTCWRGIAEALDVAPFNVGHACETWGRGARFGAVSIARGRIYWSALLNGAAGKMLSGQAGHSEVVQHFAHWHDPIAQIIQHTAPDSVLHHDIYDRLPIRRWSKGQVTLLGDAAHPATPNLGQGAGMAIEDAVVLGQAIQRWGTTPAALQAYQRARQGRTSKVVQRSWQVGQMAQLHRPFACGLRDAALRAMPSWLVGLQMRDLLRFRAL